MESQACPPGSIWNPETGGCENPFNPISDPFIVLPQPQPGGSIPSLGIGAPISDLNVIVNNAVINTTDVSSAIGDAISSGIQAGASQASQIAQDSSNTIIHAVGTVADDIVSSVQSGLTTILDWLKQIGGLIGSNLSSIVDFIGHHLADIGNAIKDAVVPLLGEVGDVLHSIASEVQTINDTMIQPISNVILGSMQTIATLTTAIEKDLHDGLSGLLHIPTDVAGAMTTLDATMQRTIEQLGLHNKELVDVDLKYVLGASVGDHLSRLGDILSGSVAGGQQTTTFSDRVTLEEPDASKISSKVIGETWNAIKELISQLIKGGSTAIDDVSKGLPGFGAFGVDLIQLPITLVVVVLTAIAELKPLLDFIEEDANAKVGLSKLAPQDALAAWVRNFISADNLQDELAVAGLDKNRRQVLMDLQRYLIDISTALDMFYRGIITEEDLRANLLEHGCIDADTDALIAAGRKIFGVDTALRSWKFGQIGDDALKAVLSENRYTEDETATFMATISRPESMDEVIERHKRDTLFSNGLTDDRLFNNMPGDIEEAAKVEGVNKQVALDRWRSQFQVPQIQQWLSLYFRGIRTHTELMAVMDYYRVPEDWRDDYIRANQALIPFRTIPAMLSGGIISEQYAKQQLAAHGFDQTAVQALLDYSKTKATKKPAAVANDLHSISLGTAKQFWLDGGITDAQYHDVLVAHGYDEQAATLTLKVETMAHEVHARRQIGQDIVNEALAGLITDDQAAQQLSEHNFTIAETGRFLKQLRSGRKLQSKTPSEGELLKMAKAGVITQDDYASALAGIGYAAKWIQAFLGLNFPPDQTATTGA